VVIILNGRFAGRKAVVLRTYDEGAKDRKFGHALVAGLERSPRTVTRTMSAAKQAKRLRVKPFVKFVNFNHIMPTRYNLDISEVTALAKDDALVDEDKKKAAKKAITEKLTEGYKKIGQIKNEKVATGAQYFYRCVRHEIT
jgi:large subunit ribosomal protein L27e